MMDDRIARIGDFQYRTGSPVAMAIDKQVVYNIPGHDDQIGLDVSGYMTDGGRGPLSISDRQPGIRWHGNVRVVYGIHGQDHTFMSILSFGAGRSHTMATMHWLTCRR